MTIDSAALEALAVEGFVRIPQFLPTALHARLDRLFDDLIADPFASEDIIVNRVGDSSFVTNIDRPGAKGDLEVMELIGSPAVLRLAATICGPDFFLIQDFAVVKLLGDTLSVLWHKDMEHGRTGACFTLGVYLDAAGPGDGALRVVPGSHLGGRDICELRREPFIEVPVEAGDALIHDMMLAHSSEPLTRGRQRRVIYLEFLSARHVLGEQIYSPEMVARRLRFLNLAINLYRLRHPDKPPFAWASEYFEPLDSEAEIRRRALDDYRRAIHARPSAYCFENP